MKDLIRPDSLIPVHRLDKFLDKAILGLENKDKVLGAKIKEIRKRGNRGIEISKEVKKEFQLRASQSIVDALVKAINTIYIKGDKVRITKDDVVKGEGEL